MATKSSTKTLSNLVINKVASPSVYQSMVSNNQINSDELYLVAGDSSPSPGSSSPAMDGTASAGSSDNYARADHVHPTDTSRAAATHTHSASDITSGLATVATTGSYADLSNKPSIPDSTSDLTNDSGFITDAGVTSFNGSTGAITYTAPVTSVNGSTGAVTLSIPDSTSDLTNDSGFITSSDIPVTSVNSKTGAVSLTYTDVGAAASSHGTHVTFDTTNNPAMDGTASKGTATTVARSDHVHPTDTSRASASDLFTHTGNATIHITASERSAWNAKADAGDIPTKTSDLTNDSGFLTLSTLPIYDGTVV